MQGKTMHLDQIHCERKKLFCHDIIKKKFITIKAYGSQEILIIYFFNSVFMINYALESWIRWHDICSADICSTDNCSEKCDKCSATNAPSIAPATFALPTIAPPTIAPATDALNIRHLLRRYLLRICNNCSADNCSKDVRHLLLIQVLCL